MDIRDKPEASAADAVHQSLNYRRRPYCASHCIDGDNFMQLHKQDTISYNSKRLPPLQISEVLKTSEIFLLVQRKRMMQ